MMDVLEADQTGPILGSTSCRFKAPLAYPDKVYIGVRSCDLKADRFTHRYIVVSDKLNCVAAEGEGQIVYYDYAAGKKTNIPTTLREHILALDPGAL